MVSIIREGPTVGKITKNDMKTETTQNVQYLPVAVSAYKVPLQHITLKCNIRIYVCFIKILMFQVSVGSN